MAILLSFVASHSCTVCTLFSKEQLAEVSDTTGDAMKNNC